MDDFCARMFPLKSAATTTKQVAASTYGWMGSMAYRQQTVAVDTSEAALCSLAQDYIDTFHRALKLDQPFPNASYEPLLKETLPPNELRRLVFDIECDGGLPGRHIGDEVPIDFIEVLQNTVASHYTDLYSADATAHVLITARKPGKRIHLHFSKVVDYPRNMTTLHGKVVAALELKWPGGAGLHRSVPEELPGDTWNTVVDGSIYKNVGLRTLISSKPRFDKLGKLKQHEPINVRFYLPYTQELKLMKLKEITVKDFREASVIPSREQLDDIKDVIAKLSSANMDVVPSSSVCAIQKKDKGGARGIQDLAQHIRTPIDQLALLAGGPLCFDHVLPLLVHMGFKAIKMRSQREQGFSFDADRSCTCVVCNKRIHTSNDWLVTRIVGQCFTVRNYSEHCTNKLIGWEQSATLKNIVRFPSADADYADLFVATFRGCLFWTGSERGSKRFVHYLAHTWKTITVEEVINCLRQMLTGVMERVGRAINEQRHVIQTDGRLSAEDKKKMVAENEVIYKNTLTGTVYIKRAKNLRTILDLVKSQLINAEFEHGLDNNGYLLGMNNGIVDLAGDHSGVPVFREGQPEDMISRSTGYDYIAPGMPTWDEEMNVRVRGFIERIYPVDDERELVQRWAGYCLLGVHREKYFAVFTDQRDGFCGKSKFCDMLRASLGPDYAKDGGSNALLYENQNNLTTVNSHASGMLAFRGIRVCVFEELMRSRKLDNAILKKYNGGRVSFEGREAKAAGDTSFEWSCKMILNANESCFPAFDWSDMALLERLIVIHHRSKFCTSAEMYEVHKHEEFTFHAEDVDTLIAGAWRPYMLQWALEGLARYNKIQLTHIPASCKDFKARLVAQQDTVTPWINEHILQTDDVTDQVVPAEAYEMFNNMDVAQRNKASRIPATVFTKRLANVMGPLPDRRMIKGVRLSHRWFKWKLI